LVLGWLVAHCSKVVMGWWGMSGLGYNSRAYRTHLPNCRNRIVHYDCIAYIVLYGTIVGVAIVSSAGA